MSAETTICSLFDTKPYDKEYFERAAKGTGVQLRVHDFRLEHETASAAKGSSAVCIFVNDTADRESLRVLSELGVRHLALRCAGFNNVDLEAAKEFGLHVTRVPSYSPHAVAEHTIALLLALNRKIHRAYNRVREFNFSLSGLVGFDLYQKTAGVVGTGRTGRLVAEIFRGFQMQVLVSDPYPNKAWADRHGMEYAPFEDLVRRSDVLSLHTPLTPETHHLINDTTLQSMKHGAYLINVSRGRLIDTEALLNALKSKHLGGVALDVYEEEEGVFFEDLSGEIPLDDELSRLLTFPNVLVTAHQAFLTKEALSEISRVTIENVTRIAKGESPLEETSLGSE